MNGPANDREVARGELIQAGWRQGSLFSLPTACLLWNSVDLESSDPNITTVDFSELDANDLLIVATQDCDLDARGSTEPFVEALVCRVTDDQNIRRAAMRNSSRWFLIDEQRNLVAYAMDRLQIDKRVLRQCDPQPWSGSHEHFTRFRRWLARRYDRPAIPDEIVKVFQGPLNSQLNRIEKKNKPILDAFSSVVSEMRIHLPPGEEPPFQIELLLVTERLEISASEAQAVDEVMEQIGRCFDRTQVIFKGHRLLHPEEISVAEYFATRPLLHDYLTYLGEELVGAPPLSET